MNNEQHYKSALEWIAQYDVSDRHGFTDEWNEAASFTECKNKAQEALDSVLATNPLEQTLRNVALHMNRQAAFDVQAQIIDSTKHDQINFILIDEIDAVLPYLVELYGEENVRVKRDGSSYYSSHLIEIKVGNWYALEMNMRGEIFFDFDWIHSSSQHMKLKYATRIGYNWEEDMIREEFRTVFTQYFKSVYHFAPKQV